MTRKAEKQDVCEAIEKPSMTKLGQSCPMAEEGQGRFWCAAVHVERPQHPLCPLSLTWERAGVRVDGGQEEKGSRQIKIDTDGSHAERLPADAPRQGHPQCATYAHAATYAPGGYRW